MIYNKCDDFRFSTSTKLMNYLGPLCIFTHFLTDKNPFHNIVNLKRNYATEAHSYGI